VSSVAASGSQTATISTEHTLDTITTAGTYVLVVDTAAMVLGDRLVLRVYGKCRSTDTERLCQRATYSHVQYQALVRSLPEMSPHHFRVTLEQQAGTGRAFPWAIYSTAP